MPARTTEESDSADERTSSEQRREIATLRERIAQLEAENERLTVALRGRGEAAHSTLPLRSVSLSDLAEYAGTRGGPTK